MSHKLKTVRINATMGTDLYVDVNVPESATHEQIRDFIRDGNIDGSCMMEHGNDWSGGDWTWQETRMDCEFNPKADDISKSFLASLPEEVES